MSFPRWLACLLAVVVIVCVGCTSTTSDNAPAPASPLATYAPSSYSTAAATAQTQTRPATGHPEITGPNVRPGENPPSFPTDLETDAPGAADAFARYWEQTVDWGYATTDSRLARSAYSASCTGCARFMKIFDGARADHVHFQGGRLAFLSSTIQPDDHHDGATAVVDVTFSIQALKAIDRSGKLVESDPAVARATDRVWVRWTGTRFTVVDWKKVIQQ